MYDSDELIDLDKLSWRGRIAYKIGLSLMFAVVFLIWLLSEPYVRYRNWRRRE